VVAGIITGKSFDVNAGGLILCQAASVATLGSTVFIAAAALAAGVIGAMGFGAVSTLFLKRRDLV
jgi:hypothetical protein